MAGGERPADASLCMTCPVRSACIGDVAARVGTRELLGVLAGWRRLPAGAALLLPGGTVYAVRSGSLKSLPPGSPDGPPRGFHFAGEVVGDGEPLRLVALQDTELCALRHDIAAPAGGVRNCSGRVWEMMSRELLRERALALSLADLPPQRRVVALLAALALRARPQAAPAREFRLFVTAADVARFLAVPAEVVEQVLAALAERGVLQPGLHQVGMVRAEQLQREASRK